jgi:hypothetical protein
MSRSQRRNLDGDEAVAAVRGIVERAEEIAGTLDVTHGDRLENMRGVQILLQ